MKLLIALVVVTLINLALQADIFAMRRGVWWRSSAPQQQRPASIGLPHRAPTGNHGQGAMIDAGHCPSGSFPYYLDEGTFLTCMRGTS